MTDITQLRDYASNTLGIEIGKSMDSVDYSLTQKAVEYYEELKAEFPQWGTMAKIRARALTSGTNAQTNGYVITVNAKYFKDAENYNWKISKYEHSGYYPKNTTGYTTAVHEMAHTLEKAIVEKNIPGADYYAQSDRLAAWNKGTYATKIIGEAAKAVKKTVDGKGKTINTLVAGVSQYATTSRQEALAECVRDYVINKGNAQPLSREVWKILKRELG